MTDRKLIEKAAKAFDIEGEHRTEHLCVDGDWMDVTAIFLDDGMGWWNPLEDDGDALRLAVKLRMNLAFDEWDVGNDDYADTRRAIVIAAAAIADA